MPSATWPCECDRLVLWRGVIWQCRIRARLAACSISPARSRSRVHGGAPQLGAAGVANQIWQGAIQLGDERPVSRSADGGEYS